MRTQRVHSLSQPLEIPPDDVWLPPITIPLVFIRCITYKIFAKIVYKAKWSVIDGDSQHAHIIRIENSMDKADRLPFGDEKCRPTYDFLKQLFVWL